MPPKASQKRSAPEASGSSTPGDGSSKKRTRFVSPSADPATFESQIEDSLENPLAQRKGRVKADGYYDSDSTDDGEGVVFSRRKNKDGGDGDEAMDDMFAEEIEENGTGKGGDDGQAKKKKKEYMRLGDIEGQEFAGSKEKDSLSSGSDSEEPEDDDDAVRRSKAGMGFNLSSFNMRDEMEEGRFSADGMYVRTFDPHAVHDKWMDDYDDEREIKKARKGMKKQMRNERERERREEAAEAMGREEAEMKLVAMLRKGETVLEALARLGAKAKKEKENAKAKTDQSYKSTPASTLALHASSTTQSQIDALTSTTSLLLPHNTDIYSASYESLLRSIRSRGDVPPDWAPPSNETKYEYKWAGSEGGNGEVFGPFGEEEMREWFAAAYFGPGGEKIELREAGSNGDWGDWDEVLG